MLGLLTIACLATIVATLNPLEVCLKKVIVLSSSKHVALVQDIPFNLNNINASVVTFSLEHDQSVYSQLPLQDLYIIHSDSLVEIGTILKSLQVSITWKNQAKIVIITRCKQVTGIFKLSYKLNIKYLIVVLADSLYLYTYYPFNSQGCKSTSPVFKGKCTNLHEFYVEIKNRNFKKCNFTTAYLNIPPYMIDWSSKTDPGVFVQIIRNLRDVLHFNIEVRFNYSNGFGLLTNGQFTEMFADLYSGHLDFYYGNLLNGTYLKYFDFVELWEDWDVNFWVPRAGPSSAWKNLLKIFSPQVWTYLLLCFTSIVVTSFLAKSRETGQFRHFTYCILIVWKAGLTPNSITPQTTQFKVLLLLWTIATYILASSYQGYMNTYFFLTSYGKQIRTKDDIVLSGLEHGGTYLGKGLLEAQNTAFSKWYLNNFVLCVGLNTICVDRVAQTQKFVTIKDTHSVIYKWNSYLDKEGIPKLYWFSSGLKVLQATYLRKGHPLQERMKEVTMIFQEIGLLDVWDNYDRIVNYAQSTTKHRKVKLEHLAIVFVLLGVGLLLAGCTFTLEFLSASSTVFISK